MFRRRRLGRYILQILESGPLPGGLLAASIRTCTYTDFGSSESTIYGLLRGLENDGKIVATAVAHPETGEPVWVYSLPRRPTPGVEAIAEISPGMMAKAGEIRSDPTFLNWFNRATGELGKVDRERLLAEVSLHAAMVDADVSMGTPVRNESPPWRRRFGSSEDFETALHRTFMLQEELEDLVTPRQKEKMSSPDFGPFARREWLILFAVFGLLTIPVIVVAVNLDSEQWMRLGGVWGFLKPTLILFAGLISFVIALMASFTWIWERNVDWLEERLPGRVVFIWIPLGYINALLFLGLVGFDLAFNHLYGFENDSSGVLIQMILWAALFSRLLLTQKQKLPVGITLAEFKRRYYPVPTTTTE